MTREEAIKLANDMAFMASIWVDDEGDEVNDLVKFAKLVAAKEREACAKSLEDSVNTTSNFQAKVLIEFCATHIRVRGEA